MDDLIVLKIQDRRYGMRKMPPLQGSAFGIKVATLMSKVLSNPAAQKILQDVRAKIGDREGASELAENEASSIGVMILGLLANIDADEVTAIFQKAFSYEVYYESIKLSDENQFDLHFQQYPSDLYVVAIWATYNHVKDFFTGLGDGIKALTTSSEEQKEKKDSLSPRGAGLIGR